MSERDDGPWDFPWRETDYRTSLEAALMEHILEERGVDVDPMQASRTLEWAIRWLDNWDLLDRDKAIQRAREQESPQYWADLLGRMQRGEW